MVKLAGCAGIRLGYGSWDANEDLLEYFSPISVHIPRYMTKKGIILSILAVLMLTLYVTLFTDLFQERNIQIMTSIRPNRPSAVPRWDARRVNLVAFKLDSKYELTSLKVVEAAEWRTNQYAVPLWHLVAEEGSTPVDAIVYGEVVKGMEPKIPEIDPQPLLTNVDYLLLVEAGNTRGQTNFFTKGL
jgi:hypothetical protein